MGRNVTMGAVTASVTGSLITTQGGNAPGTPSIVSPSQGSVLTSFTPTISASSFFSYTGASHSGSNWQIATDPNFSNVIYDLATTSALTSMTVPSGVITVNMSQVFVRVRYISNAGIMSAFSNASPYLIQGALSTGVSGDASNVYISLSYAGTGSPGTAVVRVANNVNMTSPFVTSTVTFSGNSASLTIPKSSLPGFDAFTSKYWFNVSAPTNVPASALVNATYIPVTAVLTASSGTFTIPAAFNGTVIARLIGGGGGGTNSWIYGAYHATAGGASGEALEVALTGATAGSSLSFTVGSGGTPRPDSSTLGVNGGNTTLTFGGTTYTARGGTTANSQNGSTVNPGGYGMNGGAGNTNVSTSGQGSPGGGPSGLHAAGGRGSFWGGTTFPALRGLGYGAGGAGYTQYLYSDVDGWGWVGGGGGGGLAGTESLAGGAASTVGVQGAVLLYLIQN